MAKQSICRINERVNYMREDKVNHPKYYTTHPSGIECIEITQHHDFCIGNAIKYLWRAGIKGADTEVEDLQKAIWYINKKIELINKGGTKQ